MTTTLNPAQPAVATYPDDRIMSHLHWLYLERTLCKWCRHPNHLPASRGLCSHCYRFACDYRKNASPQLAQAIVMARSEGTMNAAEWPISGMDIETLFLRVSE